MKSIWYERIAMSLAFLFLFFLGGQGPGGGGGMLTYFLGVKADVDETPPEVSWIVSSWFKTAKHKFIF